jgi:hypothetical protein
LEAQRGRAAPNRRTKTLPALGTLIIVGLTIYAAQASGQPANETGQPGQVAKAERQEDKESCR